MLREAFITNYASLSNQDIVALRNLHTALGSRIKLNFNTSTYKVLKHKFAQGVAVILKRSWLDFDDENKAAFFESIEQMRNGAVFEVIYLVHVDQLT